MNRSPQLRDLSEQHHHGLVAARHMRLAGQGDRPLFETLAEFLSAWRREIRSHFRSEEDVLLPHFARVVPADDPLIVRTLTEHVAFRRSILELRLAGEEATVAMAMQIGQALDDHIRFEERELFPAIEEALGEERLDAVLRSLKRWEARQKQR